MVDSYAKLVEVVKLDYLRSETTIRALKAMFCLHVIPEVLRTDSGLKYSLDESFTCCKIYGIGHKASSSHAPLLNSEAETAVQTVKKLSKKVPDRNVTLPDYRTALLEGSIYLQPNFWWAEDTEMPYRLPIIF